MAEVHAGAPATAAGFELDHAVCARLRSFTSSFPGALVVSALQLDSVLPQPLPRLLEVQESGGSAPDEATVTATFQRWRGIVGELLQQISAFGFAVVTVSDTTPRWPHVLNIADLVIRGQRDLYSQYSWEIFRRHTKERLEPQAQRIITGVHPALPLAGGALCSAVSNAVRSIPALEARADWAVAACELPLQVQQVLLDNLCLGHGLPLATLQSATMAPTSTAYKGAPVYRMSQMALRKWTEEVMRQLYDFVRSDGEPRPVVAVYDADPDWTSLDEVYRIGALKRSAYVDLHNRHGRALPACLHE